MASRTWGSERLGGWPQSSTTTLFIDGMASCMASTVTSLKIHDFAPRTTSTGTFFNALNSGHKSFFALSAVSVMGPDEQFAAPFLAIKRSEVIAVQSVGNPSALEENAGPRRRLTACLPKSN